MSEGLYHKYNVTKASGEPLDPSAVYFVLRIDSDPAARVAALAYADAIANEHPRLADELRDWIAQYE